MLQPHENPLNSFRFALCCAAAQVKGEVLLRDILLYTEYAKGLEEGPLKEQQGD